MPRRKKARSSSTHLSSRSPRQHVRHARDYPIYECWISDDWAEPRELTQIIVARQQPDGDIVFGVYLVDKACHGLKNSFCNAGFSPAQYRKEVVGQVASSQDLHQCPPQLVHQVIYQAIDYAAQFGFKPQRDFRDSQYILAPRGTYEEEYEIEFGVDGRPLFVSGPYDNSAAIVRKLERTAGPGNHDYVVLPKDGSDLAYLFEDDA
jgi:hypothetical protein